MKIQEKTLKLSDLEPNKGQLEGLPKNPRLIKDNRFKALKKSIEDSPEFLKLRELIVYPIEGEKFIVIAGNQRLTACKDLKIQEVPCKILPASTSIEKLKEYTIKDNVNFGHTDIKAIELDWSVNDVLDWGEDLKIKEEKNEGEIKFSNEIDLENNYLVLKFTKDIDFINAKSLLGIESTYSRRANGKPWSKGVGRVVDGMEAIDKIKKS